MTRLPVDPASNLDQDRSRFLREIPFDTSCRVVNLGRWWMVNVVSRFTAFSQATFEQMLDAVCGCLTILTAQFQHQDFSGQSGSLGTEGPGDGMEDAIGRNF